MKKFPFFREGTMPDGVAAAAGRLDSAAAHGGNEMTQVTSLLHK